MVGDEAEGTDDKEPDSFVRQPADDVDDVGAQPRIGCIAFALISQLPALKAHEFGDPAAAFEDPARMDRSTCGSTRAGCGR